MLVRNSGIKGGRTKGRTENASSTPIGNENITQY
jgi:hypothetical protein